MSVSHKCFMFLLVLLFASLNSLTVFSEENWTQYKYDGRHSGNVPERSVTTPLGLDGAVALTDAIFTSPVIADGRIYIVDGSGVAFCIDDDTLEIIWRYETESGAVNCNNTSSLVLIGDYLHFGTMAGNYYVLNAQDGSVVKKIDCDEPIFSTPAAGKNRVYFASLGSKVYALESDGAVCWVWDYVKERHGFTGNRWSGEEWLKFKDGRVTWEDQFCCSRNIAMYDDTIVIPAGGETVWLKDQGSNPKLLEIGHVPSFKGSEYPSTLGMSIGEDGAVYRQWHRRDNSGRVEIMKLVNGEVEADYVKGTITRNDMPGLISFSSVSIRGDDVYRCRPQEKFGLCRHSTEGEEPVTLGGYPSISSPILLKDQAVYGGLDGSLYVVPLSGEGSIWSFKTPFGKAITAPVAVNNGKIYFGCEDGYLYVLGPEGNAAQPPQKDLQLWKIRKHLSNEFTEAKYNWNTNYNDMANSNSNDQNVKPPFKIKWIRRYDGTFKHIPVCGGGRMYTHTAEGQIFAVEQETGRLLWRRYWPGVYVSYTSPIYYNEKLLIPQGGLENSYVRCLDAKTGELIWEAPFTGSPSWSRQQPPVIYDNLAIYMFGTGEYAPKGTGIYVMRGGSLKEIPENTEGIVSWLYSHDNPYYPPEHKPLIRAWNMDTGEMEWEKNFSEYGTGGDDASLCLMDGKLYYSCFFGYSPKARRGEQGARGITAAMAPMNGEIIWLTTDYYVTAGCTISGNDGRLYLGGYNPPHGETDKRYVWCLDAKDGSLIWQSDPIVKSTNNVLIGPGFLFTHAYGSDSNLIDIETGKLITSFRKGYNCTRFTFSDPYLIGTNMDMIDTSQDNKLVSSGPAVDVLECVGGSVSNRRIFYTTQGSGLQVSQVCGEEAEKLVSPW